MKRTLAPMFILTIFLISGCENIDISKLSDKDLGRIAEKAIVCEKPYMRFASTCCLDQNDNKICDKDEVDPNEEEGNWLTGDLDEPTDDTNTEVEKGKDQNPIPDTVSLVENDELQGQDNASADQPTPTPIQPDSGDQPAIINMEALIDDDAVQGDPNAPVTIVEWSDFECPYCGRFYEQTKGQIDEQYIRTGKVKFVYRDFPLSFHANAQKAAESAECAKAQGKFWEMHDKLFQSGVQGGVASFKQYAQALGLDTAKFNSCMDSGETVAEIQKDTQDGVAAGIRGTPGFVINGQMVSGAQPFQAFQQIIEAELSR